MTPHLYLATFAFVCRVPGGYVETGTDLVAGNDEIDAAERACSLLPARLDAMGSDFLEVTDLQMVEGVWSQRAASRAIAKAGRKPQPGDRNPGRMG